MQWLPIHTFNGPLLRSGFTMDKGKGKGKAKEVTPPQSPKNSDKSDPDSDYERQLQWAKRESLRVSKRGESSKHNQNIQPEYSTETIREINTWNLLNKQAKSIAVKFNTQKIKLDNKNIPEDEKETVLKPIRLEHTCIKKHLDTLEKKLNNKNVNWNIYIEPISSPSNYSSSPDNSSYYDSSDEKDRRVKRVKFSDENKKLFIAPFGTSFLHVLSPIFNILFLIISCFILCLIESGVLDTLFIHFNLSMDVTQWIFFGLCINSCMLVHRHSRKVLKLYDCYLNKDFFVIYTNIYFTILLLIYYLSVNMHLGVYIFFC